MLGAIVGTHTITCTATGGNGKESSTNVSIKVKTRGMTIGNIILDPGDEGGVYENPYGDQRFTGSNPNNYVTFGSKTWRIIGVEEGSLKLVDYTTFMSGPFMDKGWTPSNCNNITTCFSGSRIDVALQKQLNNLDEQTKDLIDLSANWFGIYGPRENDATRRAYNTLYSIDRESNSHRYEVGVSIRIPDPIDYIEAGYSDTCTSDSLISSRCFANQNWLLINSNSILVYNTWEGGGTKFGTSIGTLNLDNTYACGYLVNKVFKAQACTTSGYYQPVVKLKSNVTICNDGRIGTSTSPYNLCKTA